MTDKHNKSVVAYFSMEIAVANEIKTYAGGLGVLAGDILTAATELEFPMVGMTLLNRQGYFKQTITAAGEQGVQPDSGYDFKNLKKLRIVVKIQIGTEQIKVGVWRYLIKSKSHMAIPVYFLDTDLQGNSQASRQLSGQLYGGDQEYRLKQEIILGRAGVKMLRALGYKNINKFHLNEGHGALAAIELFLESRRKKTAEKVREVRRQCVFTTHTPLKKEQDTFPLSYLLEYQPDFPADVKELSSRNSVNMTKLALFFSAYANAVSKRHQIVSQKMFPAYKIRAVTNGVSTSTWASPEFKKLYNKYIPAWRDDNRLLSEASCIPLDKIWQAHQKQKKQLLNYINTEAAAHFEANVFTLVFARRFTPYKRPEFLLQDMGRLSSLAKNGNGLQIVYAGKAHPHDLEGQALVKRIYQTKKDLGGKIKIVFLKDYDLTIARLLTAGADLWLNTPLPPNEASGTSGMKAAHNGVPQLSTGDGWWLEGYSRDKTGWLIRENKQSGKNNLYDLLEKEILPIYYDNPEKWREMMRFAISLNASYFNTQRVLRQYIEEAYK